MAQQLGKEMGLNGMQSWTSGRELPDKDFLKEQLTEYVLKEYPHLPADSLQNLVETRYQQALVYYEKLEELNRLVEKYRNLKQQLTEKLLLDSLQVYEQIRDLEDVEQLTNKDMIRKASDLFPDGKAKSFLSGLTNLEAGIFSKYVSKYSLAGQQIKGLDIGYDVKYAVVGLTYGRAEYIDRNGVVEGYKTISARSQFKPVWDQQVSLEYTLITAEKDILRDERFQHLDITTIPGFLNPVNIFFTPPYREHCRLYQPERGCGLFPGAQT
ncbi:MAG: hypothetical protein KL787_05615 [Taibaiella sp.]|nr:hypothetical protein [Taibaiella sp.]